MRMEPITATRAHATAIAVALVLVACGPTGSDGETEAGTTAADTSATAGAGSGSVAASTSGECRPGREGCPCANDETCDAGLVCADGLCVGEPPAGTTSGSDDSGSGSGTSGGAAAFEALWFVDGQDIDLVFTTFAGASCFAVTGDNECLSVPQGYVRIDLTPVEQQPGEYPIATLGIYWEEVTPPFRPGLDCNYGFGSGLDRGVLVIDSVGTTIEGELVGFDAPGSEDPISSPFIAEPCN